MKSLWFIISVFLISGCTKYEGHKEIEIDPADILPACAAYTACFSEAGFGECVGIFDMYTHLAQIESTYPKIRFTLASEYPDNWLVSISLLENAHCIAQAGPSCDKVLACMNGGKAKTNCTSSGDPYCLGGREIADCVETDSGGTAVIRASCSAVGGQCVEVSPPHEDPSAMCGSKTSSIDDKVEVTCEGNVARFGFFEVTLTLDCDLLGATCKPGSYYWEDFRGDICDGAYVECEGMNRHCENDVVVQCFNSDETRTDCDLSGRNCIGDGDEYFYWPAAFCDYSACYGSPDAERPVWDRCHNGVITFCGPSGMTDFSCTENGFAGCLLGKGRARCTSRYNVCDEAREIQRGMCDGFEDCRPCICLARGEVLNLEIGPMGVPDLLNSYCVQPDPCVGEVKFDSEQCIEDPQTCNPCVFEGILICRQPAFPETCNLPRDW
jgi:hypothetical protein